MRDRSDGIDRRANDEAARAALAPDPPSSKYPEAKRGADRGIAEVDPESGEVSGGGSGAGGGNAGEDYDDDHTAGGNTTR